jgi:quercetin dioxygenase-like cupin family protein
VARAPALVIASSIIVCAVAAAGAWADGTRLEPLRITPDELKWTRDARGYDQANIVGDASRAGTYVARIRFAPGLKITPHSHPDDRVVVVLTGSVLLGYGATFDEGTMRVMPAGSVWTEPSNQPHYAWARDGEVVLQVVGNGPSGTTPVAR